MAFTDEASRLVGPSPRHCVGQTALPCLPSNTVMRNHLCREPPLPYRPETPRRQQKACLSVLWREAIVVGDLASPVTLPGGWDGG